VRDTVETLSCPGTRRDALKYAKFPAEDSTTNDSTALDYFIHNTLPFMRQSNSSPVWDYLLQLLSDKVPVILTVTAAIGHQHRALGDRPPDGAEYAASIAYNAAIRAQSHQLSKSNGSDVVHALSCFLLIVLESLHGSIANLELHLRPCVYILKQEHDPNMQQEAADMLNHISSLIELYITSSMSFGPRELYSTSARKMLQTIWACRPSADEVVRIERSLVEDMVSRLDTWMPAAESGRDLPAGDPDTAVPTLDALQAQESALDAAAKTYIEAAQGDVKSRAYCGFAVARSLLFINAIRALSELPVSPAVTLATYQRTVDVCEEALAQLRLCKSKSPANASNAFSIGLGAIKVLFCVATRCKDFYLRRRALLVLETCPRREGIWTIEGARFRAMAIIKAEEGRALQRSPDRVLNNSPPEDWQVRHSEVVEVDGNSMMRLFWQSDRSRALTIEDIPISNQLISSPLDERAPTASSSEPRHSSTPL
jgi:hypothetical protein